MKRPFLESLAEHVLRWLVALTIAVFMSMSSDPPIRVPAAKRPAPVFVASADMTLRGVEAAIRSVDPGLR